MIHQHFDKTMKDHHISGKMLSEVTGISQTHVSQFRNGKTNPPCDTLMLLLDGLEQIEPGARQYFCQLLAGKSFDTAIDAMDSQQLAQLLVAIADKIQSKRSPVQELMSA